MQAEFGIGSLLFLQTASGKFEFQLKQSTLRKFTPALKSWPQGRWWWSKEAFKVRSQIQPQEV